MPPTDSATVDADLAALAFRGKAMSIRTRIVGLTDVRIIVLLNPILIEPTTGSS